MPSIQLFDFGQYFSRRSSAGKSFTNATDKDWNHDPSPMTNKLNGMMKAGCKVEDCEDDSANKSRSVVVEDEIRIGHNYEV